jgi:calpain-15
MASDGGDGKGGGKCAHRLFICFCGPCLLIFHAIRIYLCGCLSVCCNSVGSNVASCCCGIWACLCCACCGCTAQFTDKKFPPEQISLGTDDANAKWVRLDDLVSVEMQDGDTKAPMKPQLFFDGITPSDVHQGGLGDCWLMSAIAAISEFPEVIKHIFVTKRFTPYGKYTLQLFDAVEGQWEKVTVDNYIPCSAGTMTPLFASLNGPEMWAALLEKAVAKFCGSFQNIVGGAAEWALLTLTGFPVFSMLRTSEHTAWRRNDIEVTGGATRRDMNFRRTDEDFDVEKLFYILREYDEKKAIMCCSSEAGSDTDKNSHGIVLGHAYTLQSARKVDGLFMVQLRNPWGSGEWTGDWSDDSSLWKSHPNMVRELDFKPSDDGSFWMEMNDFVENFRRVAICVRDTGFNDLALDVHEEMGVCGVCVGCVGGCAGYWCCCKGCNALCCGEEATLVTVKGHKDGCMC